VTIGAEALPLGHRVLAEARSLLGGALTAEGRYAEAEDALLESCDALRPAQTPRDERVLRRARKRLAELYEAWGKPDAAARYRRPLTLNG
jgi:serine/threonine-protein kinase